MFDQQQRKIKRSAKLISILSKYGFQDFVTRFNNSMPYKRNETKENLQLSSYERIRLALEELGPTFVKLGQTFSNREDLLPIELIKQLQLLQDKAETVDLPVREILSDQLSIVVDDYFSSIDDTPLAAASIAQVYKAALIDGSPVIIKIKRPGIDQIVKDDILLLKELTKLIDAYSEIGEQIGLKNAIQTFEKSLLEELSLLNERNNILQFHRNFSQDQTIYVPKVYEELCSETVLVMEYIDGIKITDVDILNTNHIDPIELSEIGYRLYITQIFDHGFFHADPHAGNILVNKKGQLVFIDFGAMGKIPASEKENMELMILNLMSKKADKIIRQLKRLAIHYDISNERQFEMDVQEILDYVHNSPLKDINVATIINKMKNVLGANRLIMPDYFYLLFKGISLMDGVGRKINPELDVIKSLKPFTNKMISQKFTPENIAKRGVDKMMNLIENLDEIPNEIRAVIGRLYENKLTINTEIKNTQRINYLLQSAIINLILAMILCANSICTAILLAFNVGPSLGIVPILPVMGILFSLSLTAILIIRLLRR